MTNPVTNFAHTDLIRFASEFNLDLLPTDKVHIKGPAGVKIYLDSEGHQQKQHSTMSQSAYEITNTYLTKHDEHGKDQNSEFIKEGSQEEFLELTTQFRDSSIENKKKYYDYFSRKDVPFAVVNNKIVTIDFDLKDQEDNNKKYKFEELDKEDRDHLIGLVSEIANSRGMALHLSKNHGLHAFFRSDGYVKDVIKYANIKMPSQGQVFQIDLRANRKGSDSITIVDYGEKSDEMNSLVSINQAGGKEFKNKQLPKFDKQNFDEALSLYQGTILHKESKHSVKKSMTKHSESVKHDEEFTENSMKFTNPVLYEDETRAQVIEGQRNDFIYLNTAFIKHYANELTVDDIVKQTENVLQDSLDESMSICEIRETVEQIYNKGYKLDHDGLDRLAEFYDIDLFDHDYEAQKQSFPWQYYSQSEAGQVYAKYEAMIDMGLEDGTIDGYGINDYDFSNMDTSIERQFKTQQSLFVLSSMLKGLVGKTISTRDLQSSLLEHSKDYIKKAQLNIINDSTLASGTGMQAFLRLQRMSFKEKALIAAYKIIENGHVDHGFMIEAGEEYDGHIYETRTRVYKTITRSHRRQQTLAEFMKPIVMKLVNDAYGHHMTEKKIITEAEAILDNETEIMKNGQRVLPLSAIKLSDINSFFDLLSYSVTTKRGKNGGLIINHEQTGVFQTLSAISKNAFIKNSGGRLSYTFGHGAETFVTFNNNDMFILNKDGEILSKFDHSEFRNLAKAMIGMIDHNPGIDHKKTLLHFVNDQDLINAVLVQKEQMKRQECAFEMNGEYIERFDNHRTHVTEPSIIERN